MIPSPKNALSNNMKSPKQIASPMFILLNNLFLSKVSKSNLSEMYYAQRLGLWSGGIWKTNLSTTAERSLKDKTKILKYTPPFHKPVVGRWRFSSVLNALSYFSFGIAQSSKSRVSNVQRHLLRNASFQSP